MLSFLVVMFALGAVAAYMLPPRLPQGNSETYRAVRAGAMVAIGLIATVLMGLPILAPGGALLTERLLVAVSGLVVGYFAGSWTRASAKLSRRIGAQANALSDERAKALEANNRNQGIAIALMALVVTLATLEVQFGMLRRASKINVGSVSLEVTQRLTQSAPSPVPYLPARDASLLPGTTRLELATTRLMNFVRDIDTDLQIYRLVGGDKSSLQDIDRSAFEFRNYFCYNIQEALENISDIHSYFKSETSNLTLNAKLALRMRQFNEAISKNFFDSSDKPIHAEYLQKTSFEIDTLISNLVKDVREEIVLVPKSQIEFPVNQQRKRSCDGAPLPRAVKPQNLDMADRTTSSTVGYVAMLTSLVQFAFGHTEGAIEILERAINDESTRMAAIAAEAGDARTTRPLSKSCAGLRPRGVKPVDVPRVHCDLIRKEILIVSLLGLKVRMMYTAEVRDRAEIVIQTKRYIEKSTRLIEQIDETGSYREAYYKDSTQCPLHKDDQTYPELPRMIFVEYIFKNNLIYEVSQNLSLYTDIPRDYFDALARQLAVLKMDCLKRSPGRFDPPSIEASILDSLGAYEIAKLRMPSIVTDELGTKKSLCTARQYWRRAADALSSSSEKPDRLFSSNLQSQLREVDAIIEREHTSGCST